MNRRLIDLIAIRNPIFAGNIERIGLLRIVPAALGMYLLIPFHIVLHVALMIANIVLCPLLGMEKVKLRNYIIIDRHRLPGLSFTGRFHCIYCGYANGLCGAFGVLNSQLSNFLGSALTMRLRMAGLVYLLVWLLSAPSLSLIAFVYHVAVAPPLGLHRRSLQQVYERLDEAGFGNGFTLFGKAGFLSLRYQQACTMLLANALEQIESQWCPIKHLDREGAVIPEHHKFFVERCELCELKRILASEGSVSPRKPRY